MTAIVLGTIAQDPSGDALTGVAVEMPALDLVTQWRRCGLSADFLAGYMAYDFADRGVASNVLSTVINEILENAAKFSADKRRPVRILVQQLGEFVRIEATNTVHPERVERFRSRLVQVLEDDPEELFCRHLETAKDAPPGSPGIGLVMLRKDYGATLGARIEPRGDGLFDVTVQVNIPAEEVEPG